MSLKNLKILFFTVLCLIVTGCYENRVSKSSYQNCNDQQRIENVIYEPRPATIFIHGTLYPFLNILVHGFDMPLGLTPATVQGNKYLHGRIAYILSEVDCKQFPLDSFYLFGWCGKFSFESRENAARELYAAIKHFTGPITILAHSHGCNVALNLAKIAQEYQDTEFKVDCLVLMACPVVTVTEDYVKSPIFKKVISLYSTGDRTQTKDPQGLYRVSREYSRKTGKKVPLFTQRLLPQSPNLIQRRVLLGRRNLAHLQFIYKSFLLRLPSVLDLIDESVKKGQLNDCDHEYIINLPRDFCCGPELLVKERIK